MLLHPVAAAGIGAGAGLHRTIPGFFFGLVVLLAVIAVCRLILIRRFDPVYYLRPRLWQAGFFGGVLVTAALHGILLGYLIISQGLTTTAQFSVAISMGIAVVAIVVYSQSLWVVWSFILLIGGPQIAALALTPGTPAWIPWFLGFGIVYFLVVARQQHLEHWGGLVARHELTRARDELEEIVADRTRELERTSRDYRQIFESAHDAIIIFRPYDERVLSVNRRACEIYGFTREEFLNLSMASISENVKRGQEQIRATLEVGVYHNFESVQYRKDGSRMFLEINASAIEFNGSQAIISINRDVTERRRAEALRLAKEAAERTAQAKAQFLANMSHEIRTPMAGVVGLTDLLLGTSLDSQQAEYARLIQSSGSALLRVIDDILDFSKIDAGMLAFEETPFDLRAMLHEVIELLRLAAISNGTELDLRIAEEVPDWVLGDPGRLRQIVMNLVGNAVKFTEGGSVNVEVEPVSEPGEDGRVRISVRDTGIGIPLEAQGRLFELFSQADDSTSRRFGGTGLGLAISKRIVEGMGGEIGFESAPGQGSTFWVTVKLVRSSRPAVPEHVPGRISRSRRILTAEDNGINQLVITEQLKALGYEVTAVGNGLEALEALQAGEYDLVLMDCQMPLLDGYEATRRIRQLPGAVGSIPVVALTAHAIREDLDRCLAVGMNDTITKPFSAEVLRRKLERWLGSDPEKLEESWPGASNGDAERTGDGESLDLRHLERLRAIGSESNPEMMVKIIEQFRTQPYLDEIRGALERGDRAFLKARTHGLKGTSSLLGAVRLPRLCAELEQLCGEASREECLKLLALIEAEHSRVLNGLTAAFGSE